MLQHCANMFCKSSNRILVSICVFLFYFSNDELILAVSGTLLQILGAIYETVSVPYLTVLGFLE